MGWPKSLLFLKPWGYKECPEPPALETARKRVTAKNVMLLVLLVGLAFGAKYFGLPKSLVPLVEICPVLLVIVAIWGFWSHTRRYYRRLERIDFEACLECGYPLVGLSPKHHCPECGAPYEIADVKKTWKEALEWSRGR